MHVADLGANRQRRAPGQSPRSCCNAIAIGSRCARCAGPRRRPRPLRRARPRAPAASAGDTRRRPRRQAPSVSSQPSSGVFARPTAHRRCPCRNSSARIRLISASATCTSAWRPRQSSRSSRIAGGGIVDTDDAVAPQGIGQPSRIEPIRLRRIPGFQLASCSGSTMRSSPRRAPHRIDEVPRRRARFHGEGACGRCTAPSNAASPSAVRGKRSSQSRSPVALIAQA